MPNRLGPGWKGAALMVPRIRVNSPGLHRRSGSKEVKGYTSSTHCQWGIPVRIVWGYPTASYDLRL